MAAKSGSAGSPRRPHTEAPSCLPLPASLSPLSSLPLLCSLLLLCRCRRRSGMGNRHGDGVGSALLWGATGMAVGLVMATLWAVFRWVCCGNDGGAAGRGGRPGLRAAEIEAIPVSVYTAASTVVAEGQPAGTVGEGLRREKDRECPVCLVDFADGEELRLLPCGHTYHKGCLRPWLRKVARCPKCKAHVVVEVAK